MRVSFSRDSRPERNLFSSLENLSPSLTRHFSNSKTSGATNTSGGTGSGSNPLRKSLPSPLLTRSSVCGEGVKKSSSYQSLAHVERRQKVQSRSPLVPIESRLKISAQSTLSQHCTSSTSPAHSAVKDGPTSPLNTTTAVPSSKVSPLEDRKRWLLERSIHLSPPTNTLTSNHSHNANPSGADSKTAHRVSDDSMCSSQSSPSLLLGSAESQSQHSPHSNRQSSHSSRQSSPSTRQSSLSSRQSSHSSRQSSPSTRQSSLSSRQSSHSSRQSSPSTRQSSPHSSYSRLEGSDTDLCGRSETQEMRRKKCVLDLFLLSATTDFYQQLYTAWQDQKIVSVITFSMMFSVVVLSTISCQ